MDFFKYDDYKEALRLYLRQNKSRGAYKNIAEYLGVNPTLVSQIFSGTRHFSEEQIFAVCEFLGIPKLESQFLLTLVQIERAGTVKLKNHYISARDRLRKKSGQVENRVPKTRDLSDSEKARFYSSYLYSAIQIASSLDQPITFEYLTNRFQLPPARLQEIVQFLIDADLIHEKDGRYIPGTNYTHLEKSSPFLHKHLTNWRLKALDAAMEMNPDELFYSVNFSVSKADYQVLRQMMVRMIDEFMKIIQPSAAEEIAQINLDFFRIKK